MDRLITVRFPVEEVSVHAAKEKQGQAKGHPKLMHTWWARRPLVVCRAAVLAGLLPDTDACWSRMLEGMGGPKWPDGDVVQAVRDELWVHGVGRARVLDPFAGAGSIPYEAARFGCEAYGLDLNPLAVLLSKASVEYPARYRAAGLSSICKRWLSWMGEVVGNELADVYDAGHNVYAWVKTIRCPGCGRMTPMAYHTWLYQPKKIAYRFIPRTDDFDIDIVTNPDFDASRGTASKVGVACIFCGTIIPSKQRVDICKVEGLGETLVAIATKTGSGWEWRKAAQQDIDRYRRAQERLRQVVDVYREAWGIEPLPVEEIPDSYRPVYHMLYATRSFAELFNDRQKLLLLTFAAKVRQAYDMMVAEGVDAGLARAVATYLTILLGKSADASSRYAVRCKDEPRRASTWLSQVMSRAWDYKEESPDGLISRYVPTIISCIEAAEQCISAEMVSIVHGRAQSLPWSDEFFDLVVTDPPYYDTIYYSPPADYFYVWYRRAIGHLYPELFQTPYSSSDYEMMHWRQATDEQSKKQSFVCNMAAALAEVCRVLKPDGLAVLMFAHRRSEAWATLAAALAESGLEVVKTWLVHMECTHRYLAGVHGGMYNNAGLIVCRRRRGISRPVIMDEINNELKHKVAEVEKQHNGDTIARMLASLEVLTHYPDLGKKLRLLEMLMRQAETMA